MKYNSYNVLFQICLCKENSGYNQDNYYKLISFFFTVYSKLTKTYFTDVF